MFFTIFKFINSENNKWLWMASLTFAIGFLNKYNIGFLVLGLLPAILLTKHRKIFLNKHFYLSLLVSIIIILPNLIWQYGNDFPVFHHMQELTNEQLAKLSRVDFLADQFFQFAGSFIVIILAFISFFKYAPFKKYTIFFWTYIFTISFYLYFNGQSYYTTGLYPILLSFGAVYLEKLLRNGWLQYLRPIVILLPILMVLYQLPLLVPFYSPEKIKQSEFAKTYNGGKLSSSFASMLGWQELANLVDNAFDSIADKENTLILCEWYGQAGAINYYSKQNYTEAVAMHADYINWFPLDEMEIKNVIYLKHSGALDEKAKSLFKTMSFVGEVKNVNAREYGTRVFLLKGAKQAINELLRKQIQERKNNR
jgi:4-amino-4-deoxy-L-arabinose transferase-like glycosyltransferase